MEESNRHLRPADLATRWACSVATLANRRSAGNGPTYLRIGGRVVYRLADVLAYETANAREAVA
ncbi:hypothetical protein [Luteipulveratus mongoliensis]|uniref:Helix-turn-helix domain-containing protein n=1 Tax=Luteipulveratus mongoliensis TaxID=571913 RepID=A0A0K1JJ15_9MICO|nr:hypothetical protein [Luteipulveratus mongoliensis]AKU16588.1 hypothetical protein VV02_13170 [Luteipulveratus mongoliensis]